MLAKLLFVLTRYIAMAYKAKVMSTVYTFKTWTEAYLASVLHVCYVHDAVLKQKK